MRYACFMKCFKEVGYVKLDLCEVFEEEHQAQDYCTENECYEYTRVDEDVICILMLNE